MLKRVLLRSRSGNFLLAVIGAIYALAGVVVLAWWAIDVWQVARLFDFLLQALLVGSALCGIWFVSIAYENLGHPLHK